MMLIRAFILFIFGGILFAESLFIRHKRRKVNLNLELLESSNVTENTLTQKLDHFNPADESNWEQFYYSEESYYQEGGPVYLWIGGEWEQPGSTLNEDNYWLNHGRNSNAMLFALEHRYYGSSLPFRDFSTENLEYLTSLQALADTAAFIESMNKKYKFPQETKWIVSSCSYGAMLAAWMRSKYPHLVYGALASSAPVLAKLDYPEYRDVVGEAIAYYNKPCQKDIATANEMLEEMVHTKDGRKQIEALFKLCSKRLENHNKNINDFLSQLSGKIMDTIQNDDNGRDTIEMCDKMLEDAADLDPVVRYAKLMDWYLTKDNESCYGTYYAESTPISDSEIIEPNEDLAWAYQTCTEFGFFQTSRKTNNTLDSRSTLDDSIRSCTDDFGSTFTREFISDAVDTTNMLLGGLKINTSRIVFTHGSLDPWHPLGVLPRNKMAGVESIVIKGASHCADLYDSPTEAVIAARERVINILDSWL